MKRTNAVTKLLTRLGRMKNHGIEASRATRGSDDAPEIGEPDAILAAADGRAWLVAIWGGSSMQRTLGLEGDADGHGDLEQRAEGLAAWRGRWRGEDSDALARPELLVLAPALDYWEGAEWSVDGERVNLLGRKACAGSESLANELNKRIAPILSTEELAIWRSRAVPETRIELPRRRAQIKRDLGQRIAPLLLDYKQERCARLDLEGNREAEATAGDPHVRLVTGVAGCGKTLVLIHRAALLAKHFPNARMLLITYNRPLTEDLTKRIRRLGIAHQVRCLTFYQWLGKVSRSGGESFPAREAIEWVERERQRTSFPGLEKFSNSWLVDELHWMCDHMLADERYLDAERKGRERPLNKPQRQAMLVLLGRYRAWLRETKRTCWSEWPLSVWEQSSGALERESFDHLLIDEAQFFAPVWFELLRRALKPGGHLFLCADPTQGFLRRRTTWASLGLEVRGGRSIRLERPYRSTRAILEFARSFYLQRLPEEDEMINLPAPEWMEGLEPGFAPIVQKFHSRQDQLARLVREITDLRQKKVPLGDVLVLFAGRELREQQTLDSLRSKLGHDAVALVKEKGAPADSVGVAHLMAATGLERPIVFLIGLDDLVAGEGDPSLNEEERQEKVRDNTRQIYVGITRAMERLVVYTKNQRLLHALSGALAAADARPQTA